jgi:Cysteine-rich secretory protein family
VRHLARRVLIGLVATAIVLPAAAAAAESAPPFIPASADWLTTVNYYREMAGLSPVAENATWSAGAANHSCYMLANGMSHDEVPGKPGYTVEGDAAGNNGNVMVTSALNRPDRSHVELWMTGPFHAIGVLRPSLETVGFGRCDNAATTPWKSGATLDVLHGLGQARPRTAPILFPGDGSTTSLDRFIAETPDPRTYCGWSGTVGLPVVALMPEAVSGAVTTSMSGPSGPVATCALSAQNTDGVAQAILQGDNAVVVVPRDVLQPGTFTVTVTTGARTVSWHFTVDPAAANGTTQPTAPVAVPTASPSATSLAFEPVTPVRVVDSRENFGVTAIAGRVRTRIQIAGRASIPADAKAVSANFTVTATSGSGYLTVWNCSNERPLASTVNFGANETVPNAASVALDSKGGVCVYSPVDTELVVDVNGYYGSTATARFAPMTPVRLMDTRSQLGAPGRFAGGQTTALQVAGVNGIPAGSRAVVLSVTSVDPAVEGFVTVYPCDAPRPLAAAMNPHPGEIRSNLVVSPLSSDGRVCFFSSGDVDLVVDATGYLAGSSTAFTSTTPFRFTDTREARSVEMNAGTGGSIVEPQGMLVLQVAGQRGIPSDVKSVAVNIAVTDATGAGFLTAFPCGDRPTTSTVNFDSSVAVSSGAVIPLSATGQLCIYVNTSSHVVVDITGWWN